MSEDLEFALFDEAYVGYRLQRFEVRNWGTFDRHVWSLRLDGDNGLLTGDIGSGKSTLVDGLTTLLVPPGKISYNKAAGAEHRERSLSSYVLGHYKSERADEGLAARPVALRGLEQFSVLLAVFANAAMGQSVTLAQVFWFRDHSGQPARMYAVADRDLSTAEDFAEFGGDITALRQRLRASGARLYDAFAPYAVDFRRRLGIEHAQALQLFHQTVSMKSVGNLTDFVRTHMLEPPDVAPRITALIAHYQDLTRAHDAVLTAKAQVAALSPMVADLEAHDEVTAAVQRRRTLREALRAYLADRKVRLLNARIERRTSESVRLDERRAETDTQVRGARRSVADLETAVARSGGDRLVQLDAEIADAAERRDRKKQAARDFATLCAGLEVEAPTSEMAFDDLQASLAELGEGVEARETELDNERSEVAVAVSRAAEKLTEVTAELASLAKRTSNIDERLVALRAGMSQALGIDAADLVFAGELLRVTDAAWEPAAERLMRNFGLSLLVPDRHYPAVARWVDDTNLRGRLVFYRLRGVPQESPVGDDRSLVHRIEVRQGLPATAWVDAEVTRRFDLVCARTPEEFQRASRALTRNGQIKSGGERHEKDDRHALGDRRRYVLGWTNEAKRAALDVERSELDASVTGRRGRQKELTDELAALRQRGQAIAVLRSQKSYSDIDWQTEATAVAALAQEAQALRDSSDVLRELNAQLDAARERLAALERQLTALTVDSGALAEKIHADEAAVLELRQELSAAPPVDPDLVGDLDAAVAEQVGERGLTIESCGRVEHDVRERLQKEIDKEDLRAGRLATRIVRAMQEFRSTWPLLAQDMDTAVAAGGDFRRLHATLVTDDLPRFEASFKRQLNVNAIREVVGFRTALETARSEIRRRVDTINASLRDISYQPTTYIQLESEPAPDPDVREFQRMLRECTEDALSGSTDDQYAEAKFLQVKEIVARLSGREGRTEEDRRWTTKVTDVRTWFTFAASERRQSDGGEHEHYSDSGGKSGGQKEKLAYTILAASLAYQFGLVSGETHSRTFRLVVIDEAFGRGSDESTRFGLELFRRMQLQLLVVTPLQKIHVIEPYVSHVGFVHNEGGERSMLRNLTIGEYREEKAEIAAGLAGRRQ